MAKDLEEEKRIQEKRARWELKDERKTEKMLSSNRRVADRSLSFFSSEEYI